MSRVPASVVPAWRILMAIGAAALLLAGCTTTHKVSHPRVVAIPSVSIALPLHVVACTTSNSCVAVGANGAPLAPSAVGEIRRSNASWSGLALPPAVSALVSSASCWNSGCLIAGSQSSGDLVWAYSSLHGTVTALSAPAGGSDVSAVNCFADSSCAIIDNTGITGDSRISFTSDGAGTWTPPVPVAWSNNDAVTALSCRDALNCLVAATTPQSQVVVESTSDGGITWAANTVPPSWTTLSSLWCSAQHCVALATTTSESQMVRTHTFGQTWNAETLNASVNALACSSLSRCVLVGQNGNRTAWLATSDHSKVSPKLLRYAPSPLISVACGAKICAAVGASTVLALRP